MNLSDVTKKMILVIGLLLILTSVAGIFIFRSIESLFFALGALLGAALSVYKVITLDRMVASAQGKDEWALKKGVHFQYFLRFFLTGVVLALGIFLPFLNLWGVVAGVFFLPLAAVSMKFVKTKD